MTDLKSVRKKAWATRRKKYGARGHNSSYSRPYYKAGKELADNLAAALKAVEFGINSRCTACAGWGRSPAGETPKKHTRTCIVAKALAEYERSRT